MCGKESADQSKISYLKQGRQGHFVANEVRCSVYLANTWRGQCIFVRRATVVAKLAGQRAEQGQSAGLEQP